MPDFSASLSPDVADYLSPCLNFVILLIVGLLGVRSTGAIAVDVLEEAERKTNFKEFMSNLLTEAGVVSALLLSIEIPMVQLDVPAGFSRNTVLWDVYYGICFLSTGFSVQGVCCSVLALAYIQGLDSAACLDFMAQMPDSIGFSVSSMATAAYLLIIQTTLYFVITSSTYYMVIYIVVAGLICIFNITSAWKAFSGFQNARVSLEERRKRRRALGLPETSSFSNWVASCCRKRPQHVDGKAIGFVVDADQDDKQQRHGE